MDEIRIKMLKEFLDMGIINIDIYEEALSEEQDK